MATGKQDKETAEVLTKEEEKPITFKSKEDLRKFVDEVVSQKLSQGLSLQDKDRIDSEKIKDDMLDVPELFYARNTFYSIQGYKMFGREHLPPYGAISFNKGSFRWKEGTKFYTYCIARIDTKAELEYMKKHPEYKILFYPQASDTFDMNPNLQQLRASTYSELSIMNVMQLENLARGYRDKGYKIDSNINPTELLNRLVIIKADEGMEHTKKITSELNKPKVFGK